MKTVNADLFFEWHEDNEWFRERYPDGYCEDMIDGFDNGGQWMLVGDIPVEDLGYIVINENGDIRDASEDIEEWLEAKKKLNYKTIEVRVPLDKVEDFTLAIQPFILEDS